MLRVGNYGHQNRCSPISPPRSKLRGDAPISMLIFMFVHITCRLSPESVFDSAARCFLHLLCVPRSIIFEGFRHMPTCDMRLPMPLNQIVLCLFPAAQSTPATEFFQVSFAI